MKTLRQLLPFISYEATINLMATERGMKRCYERVFPSCECINRKVIETYYPELLDKELSDGVHGEGYREGLYIHIYR